MGITMDIIEKANSFLDRLSAIEKEYEDKILALQPELRRLLLDIAKEIFAADEKLTGISWTQYIPYFNDGDECIFGIQGIAILGENEDGDEEEYWEGYYQGSAREIVSLFYEMLYTCDDLENVFGSHAKISIDRDDDDFDVNEYTNHE